MKKMVFSILIALFGMLVFVSNIFAQSDTLVRLSFTPVSSLAVGELLTLPLTITNGENVAGYQATVSYDTSALRYVSSKNGDYLPQGAFFVPPIVAEDTVTLAATSLAGANNGDGTLATLTFEVVVVKASTLTLSDVLLTDSAGGSSRPQVETTQITETSSVSTTVRISSGAVSSPTVTELFTLPLTILNGKNVAGYQATVSYDTSALRYVSSKNGDYLPQGAFFVPPIVAGDTVTLAATSLAGASNGDGTLATLTFEIVAVKASTLTLSDVLLTDNAGGSSRPHVETTQITESGPSSGTIGVTLPSDLISEVAFGTNSTYFVFNAKFPTLTGVADTDVSYRVCTITLDLPGVPDNSLSDGLAPDLLAYLLSAGNRESIIEIAKGFSEKAELFDVFPDEPQYFMFPLVTATEISEGAETAINRQALAGAGSALIGLIPGYGSLINLGITVGSAVYNRMLTVDEILKSRMNPRIVLDAWGSDRNFPLRWKNPGRPDNEYRYVLIFPRRITEIGITLEQEYMLKSDQGNLHTARYEGTYNLKNSAFAAPHGREITLSEYPAFQLLPPEVQDYLLRHFPIFASFEALRAPKKTSLLPNYPNPFNPETWIPYQLSAPANVTISIYAADGRLVRRLDLGHQPAGNYESRSRAAYWDGRNALGEPVASGVYFYTLTADEFTVTRKMLIRK